jgi:hypothetical protein
VKVRIELKNDSVNCDKRIITPLLLHIGSVGKTSLFLRFTVNKFNPTHETTLQASYQNKRINLPDGKRANLAIWVSTTLHFIYNYIIILDYSM